MSVKGIGGRRKLSDCLAGMPKLIKLQQGEHFELKQKRVRSVETKKRVMGEKVLERQIIYALELFGCDVAKSGEQSTYNSHFCRNGMSDLLVFCQLHKIIFIECKQEKYRNTKDGGLRPSQVKFKAMCEKYGLKYIVVYSITEALNAVRDE